MKIRALVLTFGFWWVIIKPEKAKGDIPKGETQTSDIPKGFRKAEIADKKARRKPMY